MNTATSIGRAVFILQAQFARAVPLIFLTASACSEGAPGGDEGPGTGSESGSSDSGVEVVMDPDEGCRGILTELDPAGPLPMGVVLEDFEVFLDGAMNQIEWSASAPPLTHDIDGGISPILLSFESDFTDLSYVESLECDGTVSCPLGCVSRVALTATLEIATEDGVLQESFVTSLAMRAGGDGFFETKLDIVTASGSIADASFMPGAGWALRDFAIQGEFTKGLDSRGRVLVSMTDPSGLLWYHALGVWPPPP